MTELNTTKPDGATEPPSTLDTYVQDLKKGLQERFNADHDATLTDSKIKEAAAGGGEHRQVTFGAVKEADPEPAAGKGMVYTKLISAVVEMFWRAASGTPKQLTKAGLLNITVDDLLLAVDGTTLNESAGHKLQVPLDAVTLDVVDDKVAVKPPTVTGDATGACAPVIAWGEYTGNGSAVARKAADTGVKIVLAFVMRVSASDRAMMALVRSSLGSKCNRVASEDDYSSGLYIANDTEIWTASSSTLFNTNAATYWWFAIGERP